MGLDMYLKATRHFFQEHKPNPVRNILAAVDVHPNLMCEDCPTVDVSFTVAYWRKCNQIHAWFVKNVQEGKDDCEDYYVTKKQLTELLELCRKALKSRDSSLLPPQEGFFFGSTEINDGYWEDLELTVEQLERVLSAPDLKDWTFRYQSSW